MKIADFPARINRRRIRAIAHMDTGSQAYANTARKIIDPTLARGVRTKKDRSARAKFMRTS